MSSLEEPLVAVVVPVYNAADSLERCVRSVIGQTYQNWVLVIVDNVSTDGSAIIGEQLTQLHPNVELITESEHLPMQANWNRALNHLPKDAKYVKQLNADDTLLPAFFTQMVAALEQFPSADVASSYFQYGAVRLPRVQHNKMTCLAGQDAAKCSFFGQPPYLVHPSAMLMRRAAIENFNNFYALQSFPREFPKKLGSGLADVNAFLPVAASGDVVFIPEILSDIADHEDSTTGSLKRWGGWHPSRIDTILEYGDTFLTENEKRSALRIAARRYLRSLLWRTISTQAFRDEEFRCYQATALAQLLPKLTNHLSWELSLLKWFSSFFRQDKLSEDFRVT